MTFDIYNLFAVATFIGVGLGIAAVSLTIYALSCRYPHIVSKKLLFGVWVLLMLSMCTVPLADHYRDKASTQSKDAKP